MKFIQGVHVKKFNCINNCKGKNEISISDAGNWKYKAALSPFKTSC